MKQYAAGLTGVALIGGGLYVTLQDHPAVGVTCIIAGAILAALGFLD